MSKNKVLYIIILLVLANSVYSQSFEKRVLDIDYIFQYYGMWCWASSITSIGNYYANDEEMCEIAEYRRINLNLGSNDCCSLSPIYTNYDTITCLEGSRFGSYGDPISVIFSNDLNISHSVEGVLTYDEIKYEIDNNRPIKIVAGKPGSYHSHVIYGYDDNNNMIYYIDPYSGYYCDSYSDITTTYCMGQFGYKYGYIYSCSYVLTSPPCPYHQEIDENIGSDANIYTQNYITCESKIENNANVLLKTCDYVILKPGFEITQGSTLTISMDSSPYP